MTEVLTQTQQTELTDATLSDESSQALPSGSLRRMIWRWHFYAGMLVGPVLFVVALTGALYVFKDEIEGLAYARIQTATAQGAQHSLQEQVASAGLFVTKRETLLAPWRVTRLHGEHRATMVSFRGEKGLRTVHVYVNPHDAQVLGCVDTERGWPKLFATILNIHRHLFVGTIGRWITELSACWTLILLLTGLYLWWPRRLTRLGGVWVPRWRAKSYLLLRDLHALTGVYYLPVFSVIVMTGLWYSDFLGQNSRRIAENFELGRPFFSTAKRPDSKGQPPSVSPNQSVEKIMPHLDSLISIGHSRFPEKNVYVSLKNASSDQVEVGAYNPSGAAGPVFFHTLQVRPESGEVISEKQHGKLSTVQWWGTWNYPLHVGSIFGTISKVIWLLAAISLACLPLTGAWMWWKRRPAGGLGLPGKANVAAPWWLIVIISTTCCLLPLAGASVLLMLLGDWVVQIFRTSLPRSRNRTDVP
ncbi:PepSY-associated TM helix domain-containing protein [Planctomicrobium piriforme]|uniref:Uncharacterized iron-regulated membrane protein n=1 Tax=Planctomicrobium piriforme TaxID=1576369 RepID=A0A1I3RCN2_9PLAN|nr:PepSY domain-containing protein [Planctomicrobium piriforme]SFJ44048.1 Uncharacterized iron-regulated membrane protein [Planctomicrobium piriforme]